MKKRWNPFNRGVLDSGLNAAYELARKANLAAGRQNLVAVATRNKWYGGTSSGTHVDATFRSMHVASCDIESLVLMYGNFYQDGRTTGLAPIKAKVVLDVDGKLYPLFFDNGFEEKTIPLGGRSLTDEIRINIKKGTRFFVRTKITLNAGEKYPAGLTLFGGNNTGEGVKTGDALTGTFTPDNVNPVNSYTPMVLLGEPSKLVEYKTVGLCGSSSTTGTGHSNTSVDGHPVGEVGYLQIGAMRAGWGYVTGGMNGQKAADFADPSKRVHQMQMFKGCDLVIVQYGSNDLTTAGKTFEQMKADLLAIHKVFWSMGIKTVQATITPRTTSTDNWATLANQTPVNDLFAGGNNSVRAQVNAWIRNNTDGVKCLEIADTVESERNSGLWAVGPARTGDGIHQNDYAHDNASANAVRDYLFSVT